MQGFREQKRRAEKMLAMAMAMTVLSFGAITPQMLILQPCDAAALKCTGLFGVHVPGVFLKLPEMSPKSRRQCDPRDHASVS